MNLSRDVLKWLQGLDLTFPVKNIKRDFSNGYTVAEILACYYPNDIQMHSFDNGTSLPKKLDNWDQIERFFRKRDIQLDHGAVMDTIHCRESGAVVIIEVVYQFLTNKKASKMPLSPTTSEVTLPAFARPTASQLIKDNLLNSELATIKDPSIAAKKAELIIKTHKEASKLHKKNKNPFFKGTTSASPTPEKGTRPTFTPENTEDSKLGNDGIIGGNGMRLSDLAISSPIPKINGTNNNNSNNNAVNPVREQPPRVSRMLTSVPFEKDAIPVQFKDISIKSISPITPTPPFTISNNNNNNSNNNLSSGVNYGTSSETLSLNIPPLSRLSPLSNPNTSSNSGNSNENNFIQIPPLRSLPPLNHPSSVNEEKNSSSLNFSDTINSTSQSVSVVSQIVSRQLTNSEILKSFMPNISLAEQFFSSLSRVPSDLFVSVVKDIEQNALDILSTTFLGNGGGKELASFTELILPCIANLSFKKYPTEVENDYLVFERVYSLFSSFGDKMASNSTTPSASLPFSWKLFAQNVLPIMITHLTSSPYKFRHIIPVSLRFGGNNNPFTIIALSEKLKELITDSVVYSLTMATVTSQFMESTSNPTLNTSTLEKLFSESTWMSFGDKVPSSLKISNNNPTSSQKNNENSLNPITQTSGLSILNEICLFNIPTSIELIELISMNTNNKWWEIDAQIIMCVTKLWYSLSKDTSSASNQERLLAIITNIFSVKSPKSLSFSLVASISLSKCSGNSYLCKLFIDSLSNLQPKIVNSLLNDEKWCLNDKTGFGGMWIFLQTYGESATNYNQSPQPITSVWNSLMVIDECTRCVIEIERSQKKIPVSYLVIIEAAFRCLNTNVTTQEDKSRLSNFFHTRGYSGSEDRTKRNSANPAGGSNLVELLYLCLCYEEQSPFASSILLQYMNLFSQESLATFPLLLSTTLLIYPANNTGNQVCQNSLFNLLSKIWEMGGPFSDSVVNLFRNFPDHIRKTKLGTILQS